MDYFERLENGEKAILDIKNYLSGIYISYQDINSLNNIKKI